MKTRNKKGSRNYAIYFLASVFCLYLSFLFLSPKIFTSSFKASFELLLRIAPAMFIVLLFMSLFNYFVRPKIIKKYVGKGSGIKGWLLAIGAGIFSHGPVFVWYSLLKDLKDQGMRNGLAAVFLYNRAIKLPLLPLMIFYFGAKFVAVLTIYMVLASLIEGLIIDRINNITKPRKAIYTGKRI